MRRAGPGAKVRPSAHSSLLSAPILDFDHDALLLLADMKAEIVTHLDLALDDG